MKQNKNKCRSLSVELTKLNLEEILQNYKKEEYWEKTWYIFKHGDIVITAHLKNINIEKRYLELCVQLESEHVSVKRIQKSCYFYRGGYLSSKIITIPLNHSEYSKEKFESDIISKCLSIVEYVEENLIKQYCEYDEAERLEEEYREHIEELAEQRLDEAGVYNYDIREAYIEQCVNNSDVPDYTGDVIRNYKYTVIPNTYLLLLSYFNSQKLYDDYAKRTSKTRKVERLKLWNIGQKIGTEEFDDELQSYWEDL